MFFPLQHWIPSTPTQKGTRSFHHPPMPLQWYAWITWLMLSRASAMSRRPKCQILIRHCFKVIAGFLTDAVVWLHWPILSHEWSQSWENCEPHGWLNKCGVISPRFGVQLEYLEIWQNNLLYPVCLVSLYTKSPTYKQVLFREHVNMYNWFISQTNRVSTQLTQSAI